MTQKLNGSGSSIRIGVIGLGKMGTSLARGIQSGFQERASLLGLVRNEQGADALSQNLGFPVMAEREEFLRGADVILLCVKPQDAKSVVNSFREKLKPNQTLVSICAGVTLSELREWVGASGAVIRAMPNTPCLISKGMTALSVEEGGGSLSSQAKLVEEIFQTVGKTTLISENLMDAVTGLSGCGPAYAYLIIEALSEGGVKMGLPRKTATLLAAQTLLGAAEMVIQRDEFHPAALRDEVTTPAGCTIDGLLELEEGKVRISLIKAVVAATVRSKNLK